MIYSRIAKTLMIIRTCLISIPLSADHPNEGDLQLEQVIKEVTTNNPELYELQKDQESSEFLNKKLLGPFMPELNLEGGTQRSHFDSSDDSGMFAYGNLKFQIFNGGKDYAEYKMRSLETDLLREKYSQKKLKFEIQASKHYYELLYLQEAIALKYEALSKNEDQKKIAQIKKNAGFTSEADAIEFELRESTLKSDINFLSQEEQIKENSLNLVLGRTEGVPIRVGGHLHREEFKVNEAELVSKALSQRIDLKEASANIEIANLKYRKIVGDSLPVLTLDAKYGKLATEERVFSEFNNSYFALKMTIPLFSGLSTYFERRSQTVETEKLEAQQIRMKNTTRTEVRSLISKLKSIDQRLEIEEKNSERAKKYYEITLNEYKKGVKNSPDVSSASEKYFEARLRNLEYRRDFYLTRLELSEASGSSEFYGLK